MQTGMDPPMATGGAKEEAKDKAKELTRTARERAMSALDQQRGQMSDMLERVAGTMEGDRMGAYASDLARRGADYLRSRSAQDILDSVRRGIRSRPGVFLSACFVAGLAFARFAKGSMGDGERGERAWSRERELGGRWSEEGPATGYDAQGTWHASPERTRDEVLREGEP